MVVVGAGRVGTALKARAEAQGAPCHLVSRSEGWEVFEETDPTPILLAVRNDALGAVVDRIPPARHGDLVFIQNGMIRPWLADRGLEAATRGLLFFAVPERGAPLQPGGVNPFTGPRAGALVAWFQALGLEAEEVSPTRFAEVELEKLLWNSIFGLMCQAHGADVGTICDTHDEELAGLVDELRRVGEGPLEVQLAQGPLVERLCAYSRTIPRYTGAVKEWPWRNGWFVEAARTQGIATPVHDRLLRAIGRA